MFKGEEFEGQFTWAKMQRGKCISNHQNSNH